MKSTIEFSAELVEIYQSLRPTDLSNIEGDGHTLYWLTMAEAITTALSLTRTLTYITDRDLQKHTQAPKGWRDMAMRHAVRLGLLEKTELGWKAPHKRVGDGEPNATERRL